MNAADDDGDDATGAPNPAQRQIDINTLLAVLALALSAIGLIASPIWARQTERQESIRAERRAAYAAFLGDAERCGMGAERLVGLASDVVLTALGPILGEPPEDGEPVPPETAIATMLAAQSFSHEAITLNDECDGALGESAGAIYLLDGDGGVWNEAQAVRSVVNSYRRIATAMGQANAAIVAGEITNELTDVDIAPADTSPAAPPESAESFDGIRPIDKCSALFDAAYEDFRTAARRDAQAAAPGVADTVKQWSPLLLSACAFLAAVVLLRPRRTE